MMLDVLRKSLCIVLAWFLVAIPTTSAQQPGPAPSAPVPPQILSAHTVFVSNGGGSNYFQPMFTESGPDRAYNTIVCRPADSPITTQLVSAPAQADVILEIRSIAPAIGGVDNVEYNPQLILNIRDPQTSTLLWTTSANVRAAGMQKQRDQGFDQSVAVLLDVVGQLVCEQLTSEQTKAVRNNSRMTKGVKIFIFVSIAVMVAFAAWGAYRVSHPPSLPPLPTPTLP